MKGVDGSAALGHCIRSSVPELRLWAGLLPSLDREPPFPLSLGSLLMVPRMLQVGGRGLSIVGRAGLFPSPELAVGSLEDARWTILS